MNYDVFTKLRMVQGRINMTMIRSKACATVHNAFKRCDMLACAPSQDVYEVL